MCSCRQELSYFIANNPLMEIQFSCGPMCTSIVSNVTKAANSDMNNIGLKECGLHISFLNICHLLPKLDEIIKLFIYHNSFWGARIIVLCKCK